MKVLQNLVTDPHPRRQRLVLADVAVDGPVIALTYRHRADTYTHRIRFERWGAARPLASVVTADLGTSLGLVLAPHLFVLTDFTHVEVTTSRLTAEGCEFWGWYLQHGLGEFRYRGGLDPSRAVTVSADAPSAHDAVPTPRQSGPERITSAILLNGGGKDTAVAAEMCRRCGIDARWLTVTPTAARTALMDASPFPSAFEATLEFDEAVQVRARHRRGHVPYFALFVTLGAIAAAAGGHDAVIGGNERSADEGNLRFKGVDVNHQFSKSSAFERAFQQHVLDAQGIPVRAFSILRPFSEVRLSQLFTQLTDYLPVCMSCNRRARASRWCLDCPKCAFVSLAYGAFLEDAALETIFNERPHARAALRRHWVPLVEGTLKPWECVGTQDECRLALRLFLDARPDLQLRGSPGVTALRRLVADVDIAQSSAHVFGGRTGTGVMPALLERAVLDAADDMAPEAPRVVSTAAAGDE